MALAVAVIVSPGVIMSCCCHSWRSNGCCFVALGGPAVVVIVTPGCLELAVIVTGGPAVVNIFAPNGSCQLRAVVSLMLRVFAVIVTPGGPAVGVVLLAVRRLVILLFLVVGVIVAPDGLLSLWLCQLLSLSLLVVWQLLSLSLLG